MIADVAEHEIDLVEIAEVIDDLAAIRHRGRRLRPGREKGADADEDGAEHVTAVHARSHDDHLRCFRYRLRRISASSLRSVTSERHSSRSARSSRKILSSAPATSSSEASSSDLLFRQMRMRSSRTRVALLSLASPTLMSPPSQSTLHERRTSLSPSAVIPLRLHAPLESKTPALLR